MSEKLPGHNNVFILHPSERRRRTRRDSTVAERRADVDPSKQLHSISKNNTPETEQSLDFARAYAAEEIQKLGLNPYKEFSVRDLHNAQISMEGVTAYKTELSSTPLSVEDLVGILLSADVGADLTNRHTDAPERRIAAALLILEKTQPRSK